VSVFYFYEVICRVGTTHCQLDKAFGKYGLETQALSRGVVRVGKRFSRSLPPPGVIR